MRPRGPGMGPASRPVLVAGVAAAALAALAVATGASLSGNAAWLAGAVLAVAIGGLAAGAMRCLLGHHRRLRAREHDEVARRIERLGGAVRRPEQRDGRPAKTEDLLARIDRALERAGVVEQIAHGMHGVEALLDRNGRLQWISPSIERLTGRLPAECLAADDPIDFLVHDSDRRYCRRMAERIVQGGEGEDFEMRLLREDGSICWAACHWRPVRDAGGAVVGLRMSAEDIQARKETEYKLLETVSELRRAQALREHYLIRSNDERQRLSALLNVIRLGILFIDRDHRVLYFNRAMLEIWGYPADENLIGVRDVVLQSRMAGIIEQPEVYFEHIREVIAGRGVSAPYELRFRDGRVVTDISAVVEGAQGRNIGRVWIYEDVTERHRTAQRLVELAERDPLTNLYNRRRFHEEIERLLADAARHGAEVGLVAIDLDGFKPINDAFGHQAGDEVLVSLARSVGQIIRRNELFFRLGGDEFAVLVPDTDQKALAELARRIVDGIEALRFSFGGREVTLTASLGIALYPHHAWNGEQLMAAADHAMYCSKSAGRNRWSVSGGCVDAPADARASSNRP